MNKAVKSSLVFCRLYVRIRYFFKCRVASIFRNRVVGWSFFLFGYVLDVFFVTHCTLSACGDGGLCLNSLSVMETSLKGKGAMPHSVSMRIKMMMIKKIDSKMAFRVTRSCGGASYHAYPNLQQVFRVLIG
jgi:hypothetical protein